MGLVGVLLAVAVVGVAGLEMAVSSLGPRCMVVYSTTSDDHLKIDIKFPKIHYKEELKNYYEVELNNTESSEAERWTIEAGTLRKEIALNEST